MALPDEARSLTRHPPTMGQQQRLPGGAWLALAGMGPVRARQAGERLLAAGATALVSWGTCGALAPGLAPGALVLPARLLAADGQEYAVDHRWRERLCRHLAGTLACHGGTLLESARVIADPAEKQALYARCGALAVDMESAALARLAQEAGIPLLTVRVVVDAADRAIPAAVTQALDAAGRVHLGRLLTALGWRAGDWTALARLAGGFRAARRTLARVAALAGGELAVGPAPATQP